MNSAVKRTIDEMVFEHRNKEYGSYQLRKQYYRRLGIGFLVSLFIVLAITLCYYWYLTSSGDETVYLSSSSNPYLKNTPGSLLTVKELDALMSPAVPPDKQQADRNNHRSADVLHNFTITENATPDTIKPPVKDDYVPDISVKAESSNDSVVFGGYITGDGVGEGGGGGTEIDRFPVFPGGPVHKYIESILNYPAQAIKQKIHGVVLLSFVVNKKGEVVNIKVEKSVNPILDVEAVKAIEGMPIWKPGLRHGRPISIQLVIRINFIPMN